MAPARQLRFGIKTAPQHTTYEALLVHHFTEKIRNEAGFLLVHFTESENNIPKRVLFSDPKATER